MCRVVALEKIKIMVCQGVSGGTKTLFLAIFAYFLDFCLFLHFSTLKSWYVWFTLSLEYASACVYSYCPGNVQYQGLSGGVSGVQKPLFEPFLPISWDFCLF